MTALFSILAWEIPWTEETAELQSMEKQSARHDLVAKQQQQRYEQAFFRRGNAHGKQTHEKMLNTAKHQGNANQNRHKLSPHTYQKGYHQNEHK